MAAKKLIDFQFYLKTEILWLEQLALSSSGGLSNITLKILCLRELCMRWLFLDRMIFAVIVRQ